MQRVLIDACLNNGVPFFWRTPGTLLIARSGAAMVLASVQSEDYRVLGAEGFDLDASVHPRIDLIYDESRRPEKPEVVIADWPSDVWIDFTITPGNRPQGRR